MLKNLFDKNQGLEIHIAFILSCLLMAAFFIAPAFISISIGGLLLIGIWRIKHFISDVKIAKGLQVFSILSMILFLTHLIGWFISDDLIEGQRKFFLKLPFFLSPLLWIVFKKFNSSQKVTILLFFIFYVYLTGTVSTFVYLRLRDYFDPLILEAKPIPILFGYGIYHIQFSILNAIACFSGMYLLFKHKKTLGEPLFYFLAILTFVNISNLHILSARTGLMSFYLGVIATGISYFFYHKKTNAIKYIPLLILIPVIAYSISSSLRNRITNSIDDFNTIIHSENPNDKSVAMRVEAWRVSYQLIKKHPLLGIGLGDLEQELQKQYNESKTLLSEHNRKNPHNQFLETTLHTGIIGGAVLLFMFCILLYNYRNKPVVIGLIVIWLASLLFESMLERQVSLIAMSFFIGFFIYLPSQNQELV